MTLPIAKIRKDLRFKCRGPSCNRCCLGGEHGNLVHLSEEDRDRLGEDLNRAKLRTYQGETLMVLPVGKPCVFWAEGEGCTVYERAPRQCRTYPWWRGIMRDEKLYAAEKERCPGLGEGPRVPLREVRRTLELDEHSQIFWSPRHT